MRLLSATKLFYAPATLASFLNGRGAGYERVHEYVSSTKRRLAVKGWVGSAMEYFSPQSRTAGGYGVVASVDSSTQVTLAAGYTLGLAGRCRLWDKSAGVHLDSGGVEWRRSGAVVTLPDTTGMAANDVVYSDRLEFNDYAQCVALETALGVAFNGELRLLNRTTGAVILRRIVRSGAWVSVDVNFGAVTATPCAACASVAGAVVTLTAPHTITATLAKLLRVQVVTDGTWSDVASGAWSVAGDSLTVPQATADAIAAALGASKSVRVHVEGVSELCIGGSSCYVRPLSGVWAVFSGTALAPRTVSTGALTWGALNPVPNNHATRIHATISRSAAADGQYAYVGVYQSVESDCILGGTIRTGGADVNGGAYGALTSLGAASVEAGGTYPATSFMASSLLSAGQGYQQVLCYPGMRRSYKVIRWNTGAAGLCAAMKSAGGEQVGLDITSWSAL